MPHDTFAIVRKTDPFPARLRGGVVAIGNFDGVHRGHRAVLDKVVEMGRERGVPALALTFEPHPRTYFRPDTPVFRLTPAAVKAGLLARLGLDGVVEVAFDADLASTTAADFVDRILIDRLGVSAAVVGYDFHFGKGRAGSPEVLRELGAERGFDVVVIGPAGEAETVWSASAVRDALAAGDVREAARILGYRWYVSGEVVHGEKRGRELGFPTANIGLPPETGLRHGIYAVRMRVGDETYDGAASFGRRPQFDNGAPVLEVYLFDVSIDLYGRLVEVEFVEFIRAERRFDSVDDLVARMRKDVEEARVLLENSRDGRFPGSTRVSASN